MIFRLTPRPRKRGLPPLFKKERGGTALWCSYASVKINLRGYLIYAKGCWQPYLSTPLKWHRFYIFRFKMNLI